MTTLTNKNFKSGFPAGACPFLILICLYHPCTSYRAEAGAKAEKCYVVPDSLYRITVVLVPDQVIIKYLSKKLRVNTEEDKSYFKSQHVMLHGLYKWIKYCVVDPNQYKYGCIIQYFPVNCSGREGVTFVQHR